MPAAVSSPPAKKTIRRCAIYTRQSRTSSQVLSSCEVQRELCEDFVRSRAALGWELRVDRYDDVKGSSEKLDRPALQRLIADVRQRLIDVVVIYRLDRLSRKLLDFARLMEVFRDHDVELVIVTNPTVGGVAASSFFLNLAIAFAEFEQCMIRERMADARAALKRRGRRVAGIVCHGYRADPYTKQLLIAPEEADRVRQIFEMAAAGHAPREIAETANGRGWRIRLAKGKVGHWTPRQILDTLSNPTYAGRIRDGKKDRPGAHQAIITEELFKQVAALVEGRRTRKPGRTKGKDYWLLRGILVCGSCRRVMSPSISGKGRIRYRYYRCRSHAGGRSPCKGASVPAFEIEKLVTKLLADPAAVSSRQKKGILLFRRFAEVWSRLDQKARANLLPKITRRVILNVADGRMTITANDEEIQRYLDDGVGANSAAQ